jgi:hypothetical protein
VKVNLGRGADRIIEVVGDGAAFHVLRPRAPQRHAEVGAFDVPIDAQERLDHVVVADLLGLADDGAHGLFDAAQLGVLAQQLVLCDIVFEGPGLEQHHRPLGVEVFQRGPLPAAHSHHRQAGKLHPAGRQAAEDLAISVAHPLSPVEIRQDLQDEQDENAVIIL